VTVQERLIARLREECGLPLPEGTELRRTYAGREQLAGGAWKWYGVFPERVVWKNRTLQLGSHWTMTRLLAAERIVATQGTWHDTEIDPED
jgi:hypothetical protein